MHEIVCLGLRGEISKKRKKKPGVGKEIYVRVPKTIKHQENTYHFAYFSVDANDIKLWN